MCVYTYVLSSSRLLLQICSREMIRSMHTSTKIGMVMSFLKPNAGGNLDNLSPRKSCMMTVVTIEHYTVQKEHNECSFSITDKFYC